MRNSSPMKLLGILSLLIICLLGIALYSFLKFTADSTTLVPPSKTAPITLPSKCGGWSIIPDAHPNPGGSELLLGVAAVSPNDVWAVGNYASPTFSTAGLIEHWNGKAWSVIAHPNLGPDSMSEHFKAVAGSSTHDVWAVGDYLYKGAVQRALAEHWDGSTWNVVAAPNVGSNWNDLNALTVISPNDVWAVGTFNNGTDPLQTLIEHWDGARWNVAASPNAGSSDNNLLSVSAASPNDVWAVGRYSSSSRPVTLTLIEHWDGARWSLVTSPNFDTGATYTAIAALSPQDVWAVGWYSSKNNTVSKGLIEHWDGTSWKIVPAPDVSTNSNYLLGITAVSPGNAWAVGSTESTGSQKVLIEHWDGTRWSIVPGANSLNTSESLQAAAHVPGTSYVWSVGLVSNSTFTEFYC